METRSGCVESGRRQPKAPVYEKRVEGNVLIILLGAVFVLAIMGSAVFEIGNAARERALKIRERDRAVAGIEFGLEGMRHTVAHELEDQAWLDVAGLDTSEDRRSGSTDSGYYNSGLQTEAPGQIFATQLHNTLQSLVAPDDPFRGASAVVNTFTVTAGAQSLIAPSNQRFNLPALQLTPQISVRQIPVSEFTLLSGTTLQLSQIGGTAGRIHSEGDLIISSGRVTSLYPVTAAGNISLADNGSLLVQAGPNQSPLSFPVESTADSNWLAQARSTLRSTILSGRDLPMRMVRAAGIDQLTAQPSGVPPASASAQQQLWRQCNRTVLESGGVAYLYDSGGGRVTGHEAKGFSWAQSPNHPAGLIIFDLAKAPPGPGRNSFYISSSTPGAVVLIRNGRTLPSDLSVISPLLIAVEGGFNDQGTRRAGSLVSATDVIGVPVGW
jgi:hypothetical protein